MSANDKLLESIRMILADDRGREMLEAIAAMRAVIVMSPERESLYARSDLNDATCWAAAMLTRIISVMPVEKRRVRLSEFLRVALEDNRECGCNRCNHARLVDERFPTARRPS